MALGFYSYILFFILVAFMISQIAPLAFGKHTFNFHNHTNNDTNINNKNSNEY